jgi:hypothetical protein
MFHGPVERVGGVKAAGIHAAGYSRPPYEKRGRSEAAPFSVYSFVFGCFTGVNSKSWKS